MMTSLGNLLMNISLRELLIGFLVLVIAVGGIALHKADEEDNDVK